MAAFKGAAFATSSSWADEDDLDTEPIPVASTLPKVSEQEPAHPESPRSERKYSNEYRDRDYDRRGRGGYEDRSYHRGDRPPRGGYDADRPKNPVPDRGPYKAFLGNLSFRLSEHDIVDFFGSPESITDVRIQRDRDTDRPKGFAYIEFRDRDALVAALELDGKNLDGRAIRIDVAAEKERKNNFFEKRGDRNRFDRRQEEPRSEQPRERPRLNLAPRTAEAPAEDGQKPSQKQSIFGEAKPRDENAFWERKKAREEEQKKEKELTKKAVTRERKASQDETEGKLLGRGRGGRGERAERGGRGGRGASQPVAAPVKKEEVKPKTVEPKLPKTTKLAPPPSTKTKNAFELLGDDSDSD